MNAPVINALAEAGFSFPTSIRFGPGATRALPELLRSEGIKNPLVVIDPGLLATPVWDLVHGALSSEFPDVARYSGVHPNPVEDDVVGAAKAYVDGGHDGVVAVGGGSALDVGKALGVCATHAGDLATFEAQAGGYELITHPLPPVIALPTTAGTGSEVGRSSVITIPSLGRKIVIFHPGLLPRQVILDAELTVSLPPHLTAATGMDAFTHCLESLTAPIFHPVCDAIAVGGLELVIEYLPRATRDGTDLEARGNMLVAASMGAMAFQKDLGAAHSLAHPLSTQYGVHHGLANAVCLPAVMRFNAEVAAKHYARVARMFGYDGGGTELDASRWAADRVERLIGDLGLPLKLRDCGVPEEGPETLADKAYEDSCHKTNARPCTRDDLLKLYQESW